MGLTANSFFDSFDVTGCIETGASVTAVNGDIKTQPGGPEATSMAFVSIFQFDNCSMTLLLGASGSADLPVGAFQIDKTAASLSTSVELFDIVSGNTLTADVTMTWAETGEAPSVLKDHTIFRAPGFRFNSTFSGTSRPATASGTVTALGTNFTPNPPAFADLESVKEGELDISH
jgi:hypothetical protein